jgi:transient receptor potential cation channel subfamily M protein 2
MFFLAIRQGLGIPIVTLLLEGGKDAIRIVKDRLREGIACVAIEGSGRAADIISYAYKNAVKDAIRYDCYH